MLNTEKKKFYCKRNRLWNPINPGAETTCLYLVAFYSWIPYFPSGSPMHSEQSSANDRDISSEAGLATGLPPVRLVLQKTRMPCHPHLPPAWEPFAPARRDLWSLSVRVRGYCQAHHVSLGIPSSLHSTVSKAVFNDNETCWSQNYEGHWLLKSDWLCQPNRSRRKTTDL